MTRKFTKNISCVIHPFPSDIIIYSHVHNSIAMNTITLKGNDILL